MSFQTDDLTILALGIRGDQPPPDSAQPPLPDGIHLRWLFEQGKGFPLHGFYLFRRENRPRGPVCLSPLLEGTRPGSTRSTRLDTRLGRLSTAHALVWTDDFAPSGTVEADGREGLRFELPAGVEAGSVEVRIGFRNVIHLVRTCIDFRRFDLGIGPSPRTEKGVVFDVEPPPISPPISETSIEEWSGAPRGLVVSRRTAVDLPCAARKVDLLLTNRAALRIQALDEDGAVLAIRDLQKGELTAGLVTLDGEAITQLVFQTPATDAGLLHEICFECPTSGGGESAVEVRALSGNSVVAQTTVRGTAGQVVSRVLQHDGITAVEIAPGPAALVDLCYVPTKQGVTFGWGEVAGFQYPLCLPVAHKDYLCPGKPATFEEAETLAFSRVTYRAPEGWDKGFLALHGQLEILVKGGPGSGAMAGRVNPDLLGEPLGPAPGLESLKVPKQRPLDLILLASLQPAMAQMLGLYFTDASAEVGVPYDYLLLADLTGVLGGSAATALDWLAFSPDSKAVDAFLAAGKSIPSIPAPPVPPPGPARAYALPGAMMRSQTGDLVDAQANVGLWWDAPPPPLNPVLGVTAEEPNLPVLYYPWRASLGLIEPPFSPFPDAAAYHPLLRPTDPKHPDQPPRPLTVVLTTPVKPPTPPASGEMRGSPEWPPPPISFHIVDSGLAEGWYSYRVVGQDIFGRHSALGSPAEWYQWDPPLRTPPLPFPWYYEKGSPGHHSIHPFAVALLDKIPPPRPTGLEATCLDPLDRWVLQDEAYTKWRDAHKDVVGLRVSWRWTLAHMNQAPDTREFRLYYLPGRLNELPGGIGVDDLRRPTAWTKRLRAVGYDEHVELRFEASRDPQGRPLASSISRASGKVVRLGGSPDLSGVQPFLDHLRLDRDLVRPDRTYKILGLDVTQRTVTLDGIPSLGDDSPWTIGRPVRQYEIFLIPPEFAPGSEFEPTLAKPTVFAQIGISAADDKVHTEDDPHWGVPPSRDRFGNEGPVGGPAAIFRVLQTPPEPPELPDYPDHKLWATAADYHSRSFFTFRWRSRDHLNTHVLRALDDSLFQVDREHRPRPALDPIKDAALFPPRWTDIRRQNAADDLKKIDVAGAEYETLSDDALRVLAGLPGNEEAFTQITLQPFAPDVPETDDRRGPDDRPDYKPDPLVTDVRAYLDTLPGRATNRYFYRAVCVDGAHNRSGLSLSTPPVYLPKVEPPRRPVITAVAGGDGTIDLTWAHNRESDLLDYQVYRADTEESASDIRSMTVVETIPAVSADDPDRATEILWRDAGVVRGRSYWYRIVAVDTSGNVSAPTAPVAGKAFRLSPVPPPEWIDASWRPSNDAIELQWEPSESGLSHLVQRRVSTMLRWETVSNWLDLDSATFVDESAIPGEEYFYRIRARDGSGNASSAFVSRRVPAPE
ncbi:MAG TPA: fibronectin type III domain-containing protein [Thermoanaerobaculia bacterium]|nr:fibronectin type III domain-containing protein [Thermoanaerobaculia bacterium]